LVTQSSLGAATGLEARSVGVRAGEAEELPLQLDRGAPAAVDELDRGPAGRVVRDRPHRRHGGGEGEVGPDHLVLGHGQHDGGGADLQEGRDLAEVGVTRDHVEAPVPLGVSVGLVAGVDDRPLEGGLEADLLLEEVGPLADLVAGDAGAVLASDLACAGEHLAADEPRQQHAHQVGERDRPVHEVVLVGPVAVALAVGVVLVDDDLLAGIEQPVGRPHRPGQDPLARLVGDDELEGVEALRRGVLGVRVVHVVPGAVREHGVDEVGLHLGGHGALTGCAAGVAVGGLVLEVPAHAALLDVAVDQERRRQHRVGVGRPPQDDPVLRLDAADLGDRHAGEPTGAVGRPDPARARGTGRW
jgi:hypothetical protein